MKFGSSSHSLDAIDWQLVEALQTDAKVSFKEAGARVGLSAPAAMERVKKLEAAGIIQGYHAQVDARSVGLDVAAFIGVSVEHPERVTEFEAWIGDEPQILECHHVTGGFTLLLKVKTWSTRDLEQLISRIRAFVGVMRTETMVVLSTHTERAELPLSARADDEPRKPSKRTKQKAS